MTQPEAARLLVSTAAGYVKRSDPDVEKAIQVVGLANASHVLDLCTRRHDALSLRVGGCFGAGRRR